GGRPSSGRHGGGRRGADRGRCRRRAARATAAGPGRDPDRAPRAAGHDSQPGPADVHVLRRRRVRYPGDHGGAPPQLAGGGHRGHRRHAGLVLVLQPHVPVAVGLVAWTVAGLGMGLAYAPLSLMMLRHAPPGREGRASASLNLADVLGTALGIGVGGAAVAAGAGRNLPLGITAAFAASAAVGVVALMVTRRLPAGTTSSPPPLPQRAPTQVPGEKPA